MGPEHHSRRLPLSRCAPWGARRASPCPGARCAPAGTRSPPACARAGRLWAAQAAHPHQCLLSPLLHLVQAGRGAPARPPHPHLVLARLGDVKVAQRVLDPGIVLALGEVLTRVGPPRLLHARGRVRVSTSARKDQHAAPTHCPAPVHPRCFVSALHWKWEHGPQCSRHVNMAQAEPPAPHLARLR